MAAHWTSRIAWLTALVLSLSLLTGCPSTSGPPAGDNVPPTIAAIPDQTVIRNTSSPRSVVVMLAIQDPDDDAFDVTVTSSDDEVISGTTLTCGLDPCALTLTPSPESTAQVTLQVTVTDASGGQAETSFDLHVVPRLVSNAADSGEGSLRQTVLDAEPGDVIGFDTSGTFAVPRTVTLATQIVLDKDLTIEGTGSDRLTLSGNDQVRVFEVTTSAIVLLRDLTVTKGLAEDGGGILVAFGSVLVLHASAVSGSAAQRFGGGIYNRGTLDVVAGSRVSGNEAGVHGGGIYNDDDGSTTIRASTVGGTGPGAANTADHGGGVHNRGRLNVLEGSHVVGNRAQVFGAAASTTMTTVRPPSGPARWAETWSRETAAAAGASTTMACSTSSRAAASGETKHRMAVASAITARPPSTPARSEVRARTMPTGPPPSSVAASTIGTVSTSSAAVS
jgi:hypothetical protein